MPKKRILILLSLFILSFCVPVICFAGTIRIDQPKIRLNIAPGSSKAGTIKVENLSDQPLDIKVYLEDWYYLASQDGSKEFKPAGSLSLSCAGWITFVPAEFTVAPYGKKTLNFTVKVPRDASGGHYAVMFFETLIGKQEKTEGVAVNVLGRIGSLFYIEPEGTINQSYALDNFKLIRNSALSPLEISADFNNTGNVDITAKGTYYIIDQQGIVYARGQLKDVYTLPNDKAAIKATWAGEIPAGSYDIVLTLDLGSKSPLVKEAHLQIGSRGEITYVGSLK